MDYLDIYEDVQAQIHQISQFDDSNTVSTTYLGRTEKLTGDTIKVQEQFSITDQSITVGILLDGTDCKILLDYDATKNFTSKQYYLRNKFLHGLPKFSSKAKVI